jgi:acid phosphatase type 7
MPRRLTAALAAVATVALVAIAACGDEDEGDAGARPTPTTARPAAIPAPVPGVQGPTLAAAGDIACAPRQVRTRLTCHHGGTARLLERLDPDVVAPLGDLQYERATPAAIRGSYARTWGRLRLRTRPAVGNHEYYGRRAPGYFAYFGSRAGPAGRGWYSYELGAWHVVVLNSNCSIVGCRTGSAQERWLRADLARSEARCTLAYFHHPRFSSGLHGSQVSVASLWRALDQAGAEVVLSGHDHSYERFGPQTPTGRASSRGVVQFVVGTGGVNFYPIVRPRPNSRVRRSGVFGVLELTLGQDRYAWRFVPENGSFTDRGSAACH